MPSNAKPRQKEMYGKDKKKKVTSKDVPGSGLAKKAAQGIEAYRARRKELLNSI